MEGGHVSKKKPLHRQALIMAILACTVSSQPSASPVLSEVSETVTFSWDIPQGGLTDGVSFFAVNPSDTAVFLVLSTGTFRATDSYRDRVTFLGNRSTSNITFTMTNIQTSDNGTYICGNGAAATVIPNCGQKLIVLGKPATPGRPVASTSPVYNRPVTLTCNSISTTVPADHGLSLTYNWQRDGSNVTPSPGSSYTFTVNTRDQQNYSCMARENQGLESEWSPVYSMDPEYGPYQISLSPPTSSYTVTEHEDTISPITCSANCRPGCNYRWLKNGTARSNSATLNLGQAVRSQTGSFRCQPYNTHGSSDSSTVSVNVQYPPDVRVDTPGPSNCRPYRGYVDQQNFQLTCQVIASNPGVTSYRWKQDSSVIPSTTGRELIILSVSRSSGGNYTCQGDNGISTPVYSQPVELVVHYGPSVSLHTSIQTVTEGTTLTVNCAVDSDPSASSVIWTKKDDNSFRQDSATLTIPSIQKSQTGTYVCTANNTLSPCGLAPIQKTGSDEVRVDVQYKPTIISLILNSASGSVTVDESAFLNLTCVVDSNPESTIRLMNGSQELRRTDNSLSASYSWIAQCRQRGNYSCTANNIIGEAVKNIIKLAVKCSPRDDETFTLQHQYASSVGRNVTMSVPVLAYPVPTFTWSRMRRMSSTSRNLAGSLIHISDISVTAHLKLKYLQQEDFGDYNLTAENGVREPVIFTLTILPEGPPNMPSNLTVTSDGPYSLLAAWKQEFNGGAKQNFTVEYSKDKVTWIIAGTKEESQNVEYIQQIISNLQQSTSYYVRVNARNKYGETNYTQSMTGSTKETEKITEPSSSNIGVIVGATVGCVLILVIVAGIVVYLVRKGFRCVMLTPDMEAVKKRSNHDASRNIHMDAQATQSTGSRANIVTSQNPYSELNREGDNQTYTELKTYVNIEQGTESAPTNTYESFQEKTQVPYANMKIHTYANTGAQQTVPHYDSVEAM